MGPAPLTDREIDRALADLRVDPGSFDLFDENDCDRMDQRVRRLYNMGRLEPSRYDQAESPTGKDPTPPINIYVRSCSELNLVKLARLAGRNKELWQVYTALFDGREMSRMNECVGSEIEGLLAVADRYKIPLSERTRLLRNRRLDQHTEPWLKPCVQWIKRGDCKHGAECLAWHLDLK